MPATPGLTRRRFLTSSAWLAVAPTLDTLGVLQRRLDLLVLGGTNFLGPAIVEHALDRGHHVTLFNRGVTRPTLFPDVEKLRGDRTPTAPRLDALSGSRRWDAVIDVWPSDPHVVAATARLLKDRVDRYVFVSSIVAYRDLTRPDAVETDPLFDDLTDAAAWYEYDKAQCERVLQTVLGDRHAVCRSHIINGYRNPADTYRMWAVRIARGGEVLAPGDGSDPVQFTDVKDVAAFTVALAERRLPGAWNVAGPAAGTTTFRQFLEGLNAAAGGKARVTWVPKEFLDSHGIRPFSDLAMWVPVRTARKPGFMRIDTSKARGAGLKFRPLSDTMADELRWFRETMPADYDFGVGKSDKGFPRERELQLLAEWRTGKPHRP